MKNVSIILVAMLILGCLAEMSEKAVAQDFYGYSNTPDTPAVPPPPQYAPPDSNVGYDSGWAQQNYDSTDGWNDDNGYSDSGYSYVPYTQNNTYDYGASGYGGIWYYGGYYPGDYPAPVYNGGGQGDVESHVAMNGARTMGVNRGYARSSGNGAQTPPTQGGGGAVSAPKTSSNGVVTRTMGGYRGQTNGAALPPKAAAPQPVRNYSPPPQRNPAPVQRYIPPAPVHESSPPVSRMRMR